MSIKIKIITDNPESSGRQEYECETIGEAVSLYFNLYTPTVIDSTCDELVKAVETGKNRFGGVDCATEVKITKIVAALQKAKQ